MTMGCCIGCSSCKRRADSQDLTSLGFQVFYNKLLARGFESKVYLAKWNQMPDQSIACKLIDKDKVDKKWRDKCLETELKILRMVKHPNVIETIDIVPIESRIFIFMKYAVKGSIVKEMGRRKKPFTEEETNQMARQMLLAVDYLHRSGIAHRDIKLDNFLLDETNNPILTDFGLACFVNNKLTFGSLSFNGPIWKNTRCGSEDYMAPEIDEADAYLKYDAKQADMWSIGICFLEMVVFERPKKVAKFGFKRYFQKDVSVTVSDCFMDFISQLLEHDSDKRLTAAKAMKHAWFTDSSQQFDNDLMISNEKSLATKTPSMSLSSLPSLMSESFYSTASSNRSLPSQQQVSSVRESSPKKLSPKTMTSPDKEASPEMSSPTSTVMESTFTVRSPEYLLPTISYKTKNSDQNVQSQDTRTQDTELSEQMITPSTVQFLDCYDENSESDSNSESPDLSEIRSNKSEPGRIVDVHKVRSSPKSVDRYDKNSKSDSGSEESPDLSEIQSNKSEPESVRIIDVHKLRSSPNSIQTNESTKQPEVAKQNETTSNLSNKVSSPKSAPQTKKSVKEDKKGSAIESPNDNRSIISEGSISPDDTWKSQPLKTFLTPESQQSNRKSPAQTPKSVKSSTKTSGSKTKVKVIGVPGASLRPPTK